VDQTLEKTSDQISAQAQMDHQILEQEAGYDGTNEVRNVEDANTINIRNEGQMRITSVTTRDQERDKESDDTQDEASTTTQSPPLLPLPHPQDPQAVWYRSPPPVMNPYTGQV
jgi:hypothetical protein